MKVIFFGTPHFAAEILSFLIEKQVEVVAVVTKPDQPQGRSKKLIFSPVKKWVLEQKKEIPLFQPNKASSPLFSEKLIRFRADLFVVVAYGEILKKHLLDMPLLGCINVHTSLLPKYRGAAPMEFTLLNGDREAGVSVIEMTEKMDAGDILIQKAISISDEINLGELQEQLIEIGGPALFEVIQSFEKGEVKREPQNHAKATYIQKVDSLMAELDWKKPARVLHNRVRAFSPKPGAWCMVQIRMEEKRLKILKSRVCPGLKGEAGETIVYNREKWILACGEGALELLEVQIEGKKKMGIRDFLRGCPTPPLIRCLSD